MVKIFLDSITRIRSKENIIIIDYVRYDPMPWHLQYMLKASSYDVKSVRALEEIKEELLKIVDRDNVKVDC